ncbi:DUF2339 domain-containing protein [Patescibacteria group bacterium]|nr:DUF2339 domain-containing protein [Patescibacteria group bacterium]MBU0879989.1 DUF2339 domain-containing protein [Patescibacteria group bacterium]MBU0897501.1 DUF2339 domain-containing protein [Patescibacteria group bacterium]MBU1063019.1 DUF2339 domain-containing protein [Patescibacteria group bacterium]MBU1783185.1 DUF2339 domain-containing protein [Patescibacteria group bacterium]
MELLFFICGVALLIFVINLSGRVQKIEQSMKSGATQSASVLNYQLQPQPQSQSQSQPQQFELQQTTNLAPLLNYIKQQFKYGVSVEEIKKVLMSNGWQMIDIEKAFNLVASGQLYQPTVNPIQVKPASSDKFIEWIKEDWLLKLGALLLLFGFGWLTAFAFLNNWIGPMGRIVIGIVAGVLFLSYGWIRIKKYFNQGGVFLVLGSTIILLTIFAARGIYGFFTPFSALAVMFLSTAFVAFVSVKYKSQSLALASLILAGIAPLLTNAPTPDYVGLFSYLFIVILGTIWIVALTGTREFTIAALLLIVFYSLPHFSSDVVLADKGLLLLFAFAFATVFFLTNTIGILKLKGEKIIPDLIAAAGNGLLLLAWIMNAAQDEWKSLIIVAWMIVFTVGAFLIFKITKRRESFYVYAGVGITMLAAATSVQLSGSTLIIAYIIESGMISLITYLILRDIKIAERISLLLIGSALLSIGSITSSEWNVSVFNKDFFVLFVFCLTLFGLGLFFLRHAREVEDREPRQLNTSMIIIGSLYTHTLLWLSLHAGFQNDNTAVMVSLIIYVIIGLICYFYGLAKSRKVFKIYGGILVGLVVGRLFLIDVWMMDLAGKIATFFLIGALLVSTAFFGKKK